MNKNIKNTILCIIMSIIMAISINLMLMFASCSNESKPKIVDKPVNELTAPTETPKQIYNINDEVLLNDVSVTVVSVSKSNGTTYSKPKLNMEYIIVSVLIKNIGGTEPITYNPFDFSIKNSKGQITQETFTTINTNTKLGSGKLTLGGEISGTLLYEQPKDDTSLTLIYKPSYWSDSIIEISLN